ncbi:GRIP and coiled-coil domain-containing protein-like [Phymastichus coffea]|uniref:GRIP and coiled-coil domain-containing protein-like n=1 Tax=Phymastichus coffea TaxID=108790 RepID=UPI00273BD107|nr:GRIP and coiled-coil domain-containing protein-like [Phymastichus coffea]
MASSDLKALFDNPEFLSKFQNLINEHRINEVIGKSDINSKNNKRQFVENNTKEVYKRRKVVNQSPQKQNDSIQDVKSLLQDKDIQKKIAPYVSKCIQLTDNSTDNYNNSSDKNVAETIQKNAISIDTNEDNKDIRPRMGEIRFLNHSAAMMKPPSKPHSNVKIMQKIEQHGLELHFTDKKHTDKQTNFHDKDEIKIVNTIENNVNPQSASAVVNKKIINDSLIKSKIIRLVPIQMIKNRHILPNRTNLTDKSILEESITDLGTQYNEENCEVSQSDDIYYLSMANALNISSDNSEILPKKNVTSNILNNSYINNSIITVAPNTSTPELEPKVLNPIIKSSDYKKTNLSSKKLKCFTIPNCKIGNQSSKTNLNNVDLVNSQNRSTLLVVNDNSKQSVKIQNVQKNIGSKPVIKSNEKVIQGKIILEGKTIRKIGNDINDSLVIDISDRIITKANTTDSFKLPKIESVMSYAESLPKITNVTSCVTSITNIENTVTHTTDIQSTEDISLAERISAVSKNSHEKILKITKPATKIKSKRNLQNKVMEQVKDINNKIKKNNKFLTSSNTVDATIEEVIAQAVNSMVLNKNKSQESLNLHINKLNKKSSPRTGLKVLKPVKRIELANSDIQSNTDNVNFVIEESVDRLGLPSIRNVVSLATDLVFDDCLKEADQELSSSNHLYTANNPEKKLKFLNPFVRDKDGSQLSSKSFENLDVDLQTGNDDFNFAIESLIEDISKKKLDKKSLIKNKVSHPSPRKQFSVSNVRNRRLNVLKSVSRKKRDKREAKFTEKKVQIIDNSIKNDIINIEDGVQNGIDNVESTIKNGIDNLENSVQSGIDNIKSILQCGIDNVKSTGQNDVDNIDTTIQNGIDNVKATIQNSKGNIDMMEMNLADFNLIDTKLTFVNSEYNDASFDKSIPIKMDIIPNKLSPMKSLEEDLSNMNSFAKEQTVSVDSYIAELLPDNKTVVEESLDGSMRIVEESEELLEEVPLHQRRCNNFYVKVPTGEELGNNIDLAEYEKFFSIQDENYSTKKTQKVEIESLDNDEDIEGTPGKRRTKCSKCDRTFVNSTNRKIHEATCEVTDPQSSECSKCGRWFARTAYRKIHEKKCQKVYGTIEVPVTPLSDVLRCAMCPFNTGHKTAYINHLKSHMYSHKKSTTISSRIAALRRKFGYRRKKRRLRFGALKNRCEICSDDAAGVEHMVSRCRRCGAFNLQWCDECYKGGYSTACRLKHHETKCTATPHTRCNNVPRVSVEKIGPPLPLHCVTCNVTRILYMREKRCGQCSSPLVFKCEMCFELRDTFAELVGHVARAHIYGCLVKCNYCGKNCEDIILHQQVCESQQKEDDSAVNMETNQLSEDDDNNEDTPHSLDNLVLELDEESDEEPALRVEEV